MPKKNLDANILMRFHLPFDGCYEFVYLCRIFWVS